MKTLKESILTESILTESILTESILTSIGQGDNYFKDQIIKKYGLNPRKIHWREDSSIDYDDRVEIRDDSIETLDITFNKTKGFVIKSKNLTSLKGCPRVCNGRFSCSGCEKLETLQGCPRKISGYFSCMNCKKLKTLKGGPEEVRGCYWCGRCSGLKDLKGAPREIKLDFDCSDCKDLISLEGSPQEVGGTFLCSDCVRLTSLNGAPKKVKIFCAQNCGRKFTTEEVSNHTEVEKISIHV